MPAGETLLGLFDGYMPLSHDKLTSETKLGGTPVYFPSLTDAQRAEIDKWTTCGVCGHRMFLLLQAYSPLPSMETSESGWNRMLYVFCCNSSSCARQPSSSWCAFSLQVDQDDDAALNDNAEADEDALTAPLPKKDLPANAFPPCYLVVEEEPAKEIIVPTDLEREMAKMAEANARVDGNSIRDEDLQELEKYIDLKDKKSDYYYEKFRARVARAPTQVLRYHQRPAAGAAASQERPLFMNPDKVKRFLSVPACPTCGAVLVHELQLMPTSLFYLHASQYVNKRRPEKKRKEEEGSGVEGQQQQAVGTTATTAGPAVSLESATSAGSSSAASSAGGEGSATTLLNPAFPQPPLKTSGDDGVDFGTATVYVCSRECAMWASNPQDKTEERPRRSGVHLRREVVMVEEPPSLRDDRLEAEQEGGKRDLRKIIEDDAAAASGEEE